jgi:D-cysteine desulfhydrase family pyridoxal phosphate-dependent enzyme
MARYSIDDIRSRIAKFPRVELIYRPTPLSKLERLTEALCGPEIYIKRDDMTGLAFGGNKSRKLEFIIRDILDKGRDTVITWGSLQSNWCLQTAAAATKYGLKPILVLFKAHDLPPGTDGNMLLERILGADIRVMDAPAPGKIIKLEETIAFMNDIAATERRKGLKPYVVAVGGSMVAGDMDKPLGAVSYVNAFAEMLEQTNGLGFVPDAVIHATGSGGTQAGLLVGARALTDACRVVGISVSDDKETFAGYVADIAGAAHRVLDLEPAPGREDIIVLDDYIKNGYGIVNREVADVLRFFFATEGVVLDPVYTSKAMIGLVDLARKGYFKAGERVVFFHTGGTPALFPNRDKLAEFLAP